jgi:hypothetical protein
MEASQHIEPLVIEMFATLGINPSKPSHLSELDEMETGFLTFVFEKELMFFDDDFPHHVLQLEFGARIPWVLNENPEN